MIAAVVQARVSSSRLPGKVLLPVLGKPMLHYLVERLRGSVHLQEILIATSTDPSDDVIEKFCKEEGVRYFRGSLEDVLSRFLGACEKYGVTTAVRITADCPLIDAEIVDRVIDYHEEGRFDYTSNTVQPTFPDGLDVEVVEVEALKKAGKESALTSEREHVTPYVYKHPEKFKIGSFLSETDLSSYRWTVDEESDYELVKKIYEALYPSNPQFATEDILRLLEKYPEWFRFNQPIERNEGYKKSLERDKKPGAVS